MNKKIKEENIAFYSIREREKREENLDATHMFAFRFKLLI